MIDAAIGDDIALDVRPENPVATLPPTGAEAVRQHVLKRMLAAKVGTTPFYHSYVSDIFPSDFYRAVRKDMLAHKGGMLVDRVQDNPLYTNRRYSLWDDRGPIAETLRYVFSDTEVKRAIAAKFFIDPSRQLTDLLSIHREFEYVYSEPNRFQNIHVDIPPKFISFVFYLPATDLAPEVAAQNATIFYDSELRPQYKAMYQPNSVGIFSPHLYSYHGFDTTVEREALVMFYVDMKSLDEYNTFHQSGTDAPPFTGFRDRVRERLQRFPLIEYGNDPDRIQKAYDACKVNAPQGRVMIRR